MSPIIRQGSSADLVDAARVIRTGFRDVADRLGLTPQNCPRHPSFCQPDWLTDILEKGRLFLLEDAGRLVGTVALCAQNPGLAELRRLAVLPDCRRRGFGRILVEHVLNESRAGSYNSVELRIVAQQAELQRWYERFGFVAVERLQYAHLPFDVTRMVLDLPRTAQPSALESSVTSATVNE